MTRRAKDDGPIPVIMYADDHSTPLCRICKKPQNSPDEMKFLRPEAPTSWMVCVECYDRQVARTLMESK